VNFEWNEAKNKINISKHGLDFADAPEIFNGPMLIQLDTRQDYDEDRWVGLGLIKDRVVVVVYAEQDNGDTIRIISLRKALNYERKRFAKSI